MCAVAQLAIGPVGDDIARRGAAAHQSTIIDGVVQHITMAIVARAPVGAIPIEQDLALFGIACAQVTAVKVVQNVTVGGPALDQLLSIPIVNNSVGSGAALFDFNSHRIGVWMMVLVNIHRIGQLINKVLDRFVTPCCFGGTHQSNRRISTVEMRL